MGRKRIGKLNGATAIQPLKKTMNLLSQPLVQWPFLPSRRLRVLTILMTSVWIFRSQLLA
jgi:hypothetical protein